MIFIKIRHFLKEGKGLYMYMLVIVATSGENFGGVILVGYIGH